MSPRKGIVIPEKYAGGLTWQRKLDDGKRLVVGNALTLAGYPTLGDMAGMCKKAAEALSVAEKAATECYSQPSFGDFGMTTCF